MHDDTTVDVVMLGLPGFVVLEAGELDGELELVVETAAGVVGCPGRGVRARSHDRRDALVRDVAASDAPALAQARVALP